MENATKALLMAAGVLLAIMVTSILVITFNRISKYYNENTSSTQQEQVVKFNEEYGSYATENLRGNDLLSLVNKVIDYNERKSDVGNIGKEISYTPLEISIDFVSQDKIKVLSYENNNLLITKNSSTNKYIYVQSDTEDVFKELITEPIKELEDAYTSSSIQLLASNISAIFDIPTSDADKEYALKKFQQICPKIRNNPTSGYKYDKLTSNDSGIKGRSIFKDVKIYYEYMQLKKALFNGKVTGQDTNTGRITNMYFEFTGKIQ